MHQQQVGSSTWVLLRAPPMGFGETETAALPTMHAAAAARSGATAAASPPPRAAKAAVTPEPPPRTLEDYALALSSPQQQQQPQTRNVVSPQPQQQPPQTAASKAQSKEPELIKTQRVKKIRKSVANAPVAYAEDDNDVQEPQAQTNALAESLQRLLSRAADERGASQGGAQDEAAEQDGDRLGKGGRKRRRGSEAGDGGGGGDDLAAAAIEAGSLVSSTSAPALGPSSVRSAMDLLLPARASGLLPSLPFSVLKPLLLSLATSMAEGESVESSEQTAARSLLLIFTRAALVWIPGLTMQSRITHMHAGEGRALDADSSQEDVAAVSSSLDAVIAALYILSAPGMPTQVCNWFFTWLFLCLQLQCFSFSSAWHGMASPRFRTAAAAHRAPVVPPPPQRCTSRRFWSRRYASSSTACSTTSWSSTTPASLGSGGPPSSTKV